MRGASEILILLVFLLLGPLALAGQEVDPSPQLLPGESLKVSLITIGQGDLVWERFGHNALLIQDEATGWERTFHWGVFSFQQEDFIPRLIRGTMLYGMGLADHRAALLEYQRDGRPVWVQELALTPAQRWELLSLVEENYRPENRDYRYDYYRDNCSTRVRDHLDQVLDGQIQARFSSDTTAFTYRWHTRRILRALPPYYLGIQFVLGPRADRPITVWDEMFLPPTLMERLREIQVGDGSGGLRPLVADERVLFDSGRSGPPTAPPFAFPIFLAVGVLWGGIFLVLVGRGSSMGAGRRVGVALVGGVWALVAALGGSLLLGAWVFTDHVFWYANFNLFQVNPLFLPLLAAFLLFLVQGRFPTWGSRLTFYLALISVVGLGVELLPGLGQRNAEILAFTLPLNLALWVGCASLPSRKGEESREKVKGTG